MRGLLATMAKTSRFSNMQMMVDMVGYGRAPIHHAAHLANVGMLRALHEVGAPVEQLDQKKKSVEDLITKSMPDSHAPELLTEMLKPLDKLKAAGNAARAAHKLRVGAKHALVLPHGRGAGNGLLSTTTVVP